MKASSTKFPDAVSAVLLPAGQVWDGTDDDVTAKPWESSPPQITERAPAGFIDFAWYEEQRVKLSAQVVQVQHVNQSLARSWYKIIRRSLTDLPIQDGGRSIQNPHYGANLQAIATALGLAHRTFAAYRTAVSRIRNEAHFEELIAGSSWGTLVFRLNSSPARRVNADGAPEGAGSSENPALHAVKRRFNIAVPVAVSDYLMEHGLDAPDVTAVIVSYLRQPRVQRELLKLFRAAEGRDDAA